MNIKCNLVKIAEKITGRKCCRCHFNVAGRCCHPAGSIFMRCWQSIARPGFQERQAQEPGDMTQEEKYQLGKIVETLQEASETAKDGGLLEDDEDDTFWPQPW